MWNKLIILIVTLVCKHFVATLVLFFIYYVINVTLIMFINTRCLIGKHSYHLDTPKPVAEPEI